MEVGQPLFGERVERQRHAGRHADAARAFPQLLHVEIGVRIRLGGEDVGGEPQDPLGFVRLHELLDVLFEVIEDFDLRQRFLIGYEHAVLMEGGM